MPSEPETYEAVEEAFLDLPEVDAGAPDEPAPVAPVAAAQVVPAVVPPAVPAAPVVDPDLPRLLGLTIPATADYPAYLHGKPFSELVKSQIEASRKITELGTARATAEDEARALRATLNVLKELAPGAPAPTAASTPAEKKAFLEANGLSMKQFFDDPDAFYAQLAQVVTGMATAAVDGRIKPFEEGFETARQQGDLQSIRIASDRAMVILARENGFNTKEEAAPFIKRFEAVLAHIADAAGRHEQGPMSAEAWIAAYKDFEQKVGLAPLSMPAVLPRGEGGGNPPVATRGSQTSAALARGRTGPTPRLRKIADDLLKDAGIDDVDFAGKVEQELVDGIQRGVIHGEG